MGGESTGQRWMEVENQEGQGPLWAVAPLMMMMMMEKTSSCGWTRHIQEGGLDVRGNCMASLVRGYNSDGLLPVGTPQEACLCSPSQDYRRSRGKTSSSCNNGWCQHVRACPRQCHAAYCHLPWKGQGPLQTLIVTATHPKYYHLIACAIWKWCVLKTKHHRTYVANIQTGFSTMITLWTACALILFCCV
jgi:hypothetical protein